MKKPLIIISIVICTFTILTGCGTTMPDLTEEQYQAAAEYAAGLVLKYSTKYDNGIATQAEIDSENARLERALKYKKEKEEKKAEEAAQKESVSGNSPVVQALTFENPAEFLELEDINIRFEGYDISDSYPLEGAENYSAPMDAEEGNKLLILKFSLANESSGERSVDILSKYPLFRISINGGASYSTFTTLLLDDLSTYQDTVAAGESKNLVILAEVSEQEAESVQSLSLSVKYNGSTATVPLQ